MGLSLASSDQDFRSLPLPDDSAPVGSLDSDIIEWCNSRLQRGISFVESQVGYDKIDKALSEIFYYERSSDVTYVPTAQRSNLSRTRANLIAKIAEDLTAELTDTRYFWNYTTQNPRYQSQARLSNKTAERWYDNRQIALRIGDVIRDYTVAGSGFAHLFYSRRLDDMMVEAVDPRSVFPIDPISYHTVQDCLGVILRQARTPEWFFDEFGKHVSPEENGSLTDKIFGWLTRTLDSPGANSGPLSRRSSADKAIPHTPTVFVNTLYLKDNRVNKTSKTLRLGPWSGDEGQQELAPGESPAPLAPWSYEVPPGAPLYPFNRLIVWSGNVLGYDGPAPYWHAKFPIIKLTLNPWSRSWFGKAPLWDCIPLQHSINQNLRVVDDHNQQAANPTVIGDRNVSRAEMNKFDSRAPGAKIRTNMASGKGIVISPPPPLDANFWRTIDWAVEMMSKLAGTADPSAMAGLAQIPSDDTIDTLMKAMTPGIRLRSRILEAFYTELSEQWLYCNAEFDSLSKRLALFGPSGATPEDFDFNPRSFIPDDVPDGSPGDIGSTEDALGADSPRPLYARAKSMLQSFICKFDPSSLLNSAAQQELMKYFLLAKMGYISVFTLLDKMGVQNFAPPTLKIPDDEIGRLQLQQQLGIGMLSNAQGRKATDQAPPSLGQSGGSPTIQTS